MERFDEVSIWNLMNPPAIQVQKMQTSTLATTTLSTTTTDPDIQTLVSEALASVRQPEMKLMPLTNNVDVELYDHRNISFDNDVWVQFVIVAGITFVVVFLIVLTGLLAVYTLPSTGSLDITHPATRSRTETSAHPELNPMLTNNNNNV